LCDRNVVAAMTTTMRDARATVPPSALYSRLPNPSRIYIIFAVAKHVKNPHYIRGCQTRQEFVLYSRLPNMSRIRIMSAVAKHVKKTKGHARLTLHRKVGWWVLSKQKTLRRQFRKVCRALISTSHRMSPHTQRKRAHGDRVICRYGLGSIELSSCAN
jgi:hypothetical protein